MTTADLQELVVIEKAQALDYFTQPGKIDPVLATIREHVDSFGVRDASTPEGREQIASFAYKVARSKTYLEGIGKMLADEQKEVPKKIDRTRKHIRDTLDAWRDEVRAPLTQWEEAERERVRLHRDAIERLRVPSWARDPGVTVQELRKLLADVEAFEVDEVKCAEFAGEYALAVTQGRAELVELLKAAAKREEEAAELARLRAEKEAAERQAREERIAREAEERGRREEAEAAEKREAELLKQVEREREFRELVEARAKRQEELDRLADESRARREKDEAEARENEKAWRGKVHSAAVAYLVERLGIENAKAKELVVAIARGEVPRVRFDY